MSAPPVPPAIITNIQSTVEGALHGPGVSLVTVQSTSIPVYRFLPGDSWRPALLIEGTTRIPDSYLPIHDGLVQGIGLARNRGVVRLELDLAQPSGLTVRQYAGLPHFLCLAVDRRPLRRTMSARRIHLDPGYDYVNTGRRTNPPEKEKALEVASYLGEHLSSLGCEVILNRREERSSPIDFRLARAKKRRADAIVSLHLSRHPLASLRGFRVLWHTEAGMPLARVVYQALGARLGPPDRGMEQGQPWEAWTETPAVTVEFAAISNPLERSWLRDPSFLKRVAGGIANGLGLFFYKVGHSPSHGCCAPGIGCDYKVTPAPKGGMDGRAANDAGE